MAKTRTPGQALDLYAVRNPRILSDGWGAQFCDQTLSEMWERYPWDETLEPLPPFFLQENEQWHGPPLSVIPSDFDHLHEVWIQGHTGQRYELHVQRHLPRSIASGVPTTIMYDESRHGFRVHPASSLQTPFWWVEGTYKKTPTKLTNSNLNSFVLPWEDSFFEVFQSGVEWRVKRFLGDREWVSDRQLYEFLLREMAGMAGLAAGPFVVAPNESLELGG